MEEERAVDVVYLDLSKDTEGQFSLEKKRLGGDLMSVYKYLMGECKGSGIRISSSVSSGRTGGNRHKLKYRKFCLKIRKCFLL